MTAQQLKNSILQLAVQGKLVPQDKNDEPASVLLERIKAEKQALIKAGKIKKEKPLSPITEDEIPFEIPESWCWCRLSELGITQTGNTPSKANPANFGNFIPFIGPGDISNGIINYDNQGLSEQGKECGRICPPNTIVQVCIGGSIGKAAITNREIAFNQQINSITTILCDYRFIFYSMISDYFVSFIKANAGGTATPIINRGMWDKILLPLPPLEEQRRIVSKIEELLPYIEKYDKAETKLTELNTKFPDALKKSILQEAVQGKLVPQNPDDEPASVLLERIRAEKQALIKAGKIKKDKYESVIVTRDDVPYEIPDNWTWCTLNDVVIQVADIDHKMPPTVEKEGFPYISPLDFTEDGIDYNKAKKIGKEDFEKLAAKIKPKRNDIIFPRYGTIGVIRLVETDIDFLVSYSCCTIQNTTNMDYRYIYYVLKSPLIKDEINKYINKTTQPNVGLKSIKSFLFPLPPLAEQKRIVAKIEELMPFIGNLAK